MSLHRSEKWQKTTLKEAVGTEQAESGTPVGMESQGGQNS
jgi:hypothetical protein